MLQPKTPAPSFETVDHRGNPVRSSDLDGQRYVLWFYPKADTPGWTLQGCGFRDRIRDFEELGVQVLGVSFDTVEENRAFAEKFDFPFPLLCDTGRELGLAFEAARSDADGFAKRLTYVIGPDGTIEQAIDTRDPAKQADQILASLGHPVR